MYHVSKSSAENNSKICFKKGDLVLYRKSLLAGHVYYAKFILGDPGADSGDEGKSKRAEKYDTKKSKERREELFSPFFTFLRSIYIFPPV